MDPAIAAARWATDWLRTLTVKPIDTLHIEDQTVTVEVGQGLAHLSLFSTVTKSTWIVPLNEAQLAGLNQMLSMAATELRMGRARRESNRSQASL